MSIPSGWGWSITNNSWCHCVYTQFSMGGVHWYSSGHRLYPFCRDIGFFWPISSLKPRLRISKPILQGLPQIYHPYSPRYTVPRLHEATVSIDCYFSTQVIIHYQYWIWQTPKKHIMAHFRYIADKHSSQLVCIHNRFQPNMTSLQGCSEYPGDSDKVKTAAVHSHYIPIIYHPEINRGWLESPPVNGGF